MLLKIVFRLEAICRGVLRKISLQSDENRHPENRIAVSPFYGPAAMRRVFLMIVNKKPFPGERLRSWQEPDQALLRRLSKAASSSASSFGSLSPNFL